MMDYRIGAALAEQHRDDLLRQAERHRLLHRERGESPIQTTPTDSVRWWRRLGVKVDWTTQPREGASARFRTNKPGACSRSSSTTGPYGVRCAPGRAARRRQVAATLGRSRQSSGLAGSVVAVQCRQCGRSNQDGREFCFSCGAFLEWEGEQVDRGQATIVAVPPGPSWGSARETVRRLSVSLSPLNASVTPGERTSLLVTVSNLGTTVEGADLNLAGLPKDWWSFDPARVLAVAKQRDQSDAQCSSPPSHLIEGGRISS